MRIFKSHPLLKLVNSYIIDSPQPSNLSYLWNFGSLLAFCLIIQIITGVTLAMHYNANVLEAFNSVEHIMRDVNNGWLIRYLHSNTASAFFFIVYLHIGRGLYYGSYKAPRTLVWTIGTVIFILMMATAFLGYYNGPIWFKLNLKFFMHLTLLLSLVSFTIFYLDDFKLLSSYPILYFQIFTFVNILFILIILIMWGLPICMDTICYANDKGDINIHGQISVGKEAAAELAKGMHTIGGQLGLGVSMAGVATEVGKCIAKSSMPPLQKAGVILGGAMAVGFGHSIITTINRHNLNSIYSYNSGINNINSVTSNTDNVNNIYSNINKLVDDSSLSSLQTLLFNIEGLSIICLSLILILCIQIIFKFYLKDCITLNLSGILGININKKVEYYLNKIIKLNKKTSNLYVWLILTIVIIALSLSIYASNKLFNNIDSYIAAHNNIKK